MLNFEFHDVIYRGAHNEFLLATTVGIRQRIAPFRRAQFAMQDRLAKSHEEHGAIVAAIARGESETASELMRTHVGIVRAASRDYVHGLEATAPGPIFAPDQADDRLTRQTGVRGDTSSQPI
jgi:DNA-binding FadR family transcriptional regulator